jgi:hypothetical protein
LGTGRGCVRVMLRLSFEVSVTKVAPWPEYERNGNVTMEIVHKVYNMHTH